MDDSAVRYLEDAAARLENLDGLLDRARDNAGAFHDRVQKLQQTVFRATREAHELVKAMKDR